MIVIATIGYTKFRMNLKDIPVIAALQEVEYRYLNGETLYFIKDKPQAKIEFTIIPEDNLKVGEAVEEFCKELYKRTAKECQDSESKRYALKQELKELRAPKEKVVEDD